MNRLPLFIFFGVGQSGVSRVDLAESICMTVFFFFFSLFSFSLFFLFFSFFFFSLFSIPFFFALVCIYHTTRHICHLDNPPEACSPLRQGYLEEPRETVDR